MRLDGLRKRSFAITTSEREPGNDRARAALQERRIAGGIGAARREVGVDDAESGGELALGAAVGHRILRVRGARRRHYGAVEDVHELGADKQVIAAIFAKPEI